jgi:hypothetical protein
MFLKWRYVKHNYLVNRWELKHWFGFGRTIATVYPDNVWYIWDRNKVCIGIGRESSIPVSKKAAEINIANNKGLVL